MLANIKKNPRVMLSDVNMVLLMRDRCLVLRSGTLELGQQKSPMYFSFLARDMQRPPLIHSMTNPLAIRSNELH
jgi:hypothetical protein